MTIVEFLTARYDEDEVVAREAMVVIGDDLTEYQIAEWWEKPEHGRVYAGHWHKVAQAGVTFGEPEFHNTAALPHIARHDPARILADIAAKRAIMAACGLILKVDGWEYTDAPDLAESTLRLLASVYVDHPDYQQEWKL